METFQVRLAMMQQQSASAAVAAPDDHLVNVFKQHFPGGIKVLLVGIDDVTQTIIEGHLQPPDRYKITKRADGLSALKLLKDRDRFSFDLVISDVSLKGMDGYKFIERHQRLNTNIPHILTCGVQTLDETKKAFRSGVSYILWKPVNECTIKNLWQHVLRIRVQPKQQQQQHHENSLQPRRQQQQHHNHHDDVASNEGKGRRVEDNSGFMNHDGKPSKKRRLYWEPELDRKFVNSYERLGPDATAKMILEDMNVPELTRENVSSHLQKYKEGLKKKGRAQQDQNTDAILVSQIPQSSSEVTSHGIFDIRNNSSSTQSSVPFQHDESLLLGPSTSNDYHPQLTFPCDDVSTHDGHLLLAQPMQMQPLKQNFNNFEYFGHPGSLALVPNSSLLENGKNMQQEQTLVSIVEISDQFQNLSLGSSNGGNMQQLQQQQINQNLMQPLDDGVDNREFFIFFDGDDFGIISSDEMIESNSDLMISNSSSSNINSVQNNALESLD